MIDDLNESNTLVEKMKAALPLYAYPGKQLTRTEIAGRMVKKSNVLKITDVMYMGDEGGIGCTIPFNEETEIAVVSLTHLKMKEKTPLTKEIRQYQIKRTNALARSNG